MLHSLPSTVRSSRWAQHLPRRELKAIDELGQIVEVDESTEIMAADQRGRRCFVVLDGSFRVEAPEVRGTIIGGEVAGELALLTGNRRNAAVVANADSHVYSVRSADFASLLAAAPKFRTRVVNRAAWRMGVEPNQVPLPAQFVRAHAS